MEEERLFLNEINTCLKERELAVCSSRAFKQLIDTQSPQRLFELARKYLIEDSTIHPLRVREMLLTKFVNQFINRGELTNKNKKQLAELLTDGTRSVNLLKNVDGGNLAMLDFQDILKILQRDLHYDRENADYDARSPLLYLSGYNQYFDCLPQEEQLVLLREFVLPYIKNNLSLKDVEFLGTTKDNFIKAAFKNHAENQLIECLSGDEGQKIELIFKTFSRGQRFDDDKMLASSPMFAKNGKYHKQYQKEKLVIAANKIKGIFKDNHNLILVIALPIAIGVIMTVSAVMALSINEHPISDKQDLPTHEEVYEVNEGDFITFYQDKDNGGA